MNQNNIIKMKKAIKEVLEAGFKFHKVFHKTYSSGLIGELLVMQRLLETYEKELCSEDSDIKYEGNSKKNFDIVLNLKGKEYKINAKATTTQEHGRPKWVNQNPSKFVNYEQNQSGRYIITKIKNHDPTLFYVYVDANKWLESGKTDFYVLSDKDVKQKCTYDFIKAHSGKHEKEYTNLWIEFKHVENFNDPILGKFKNI